MRNDIFFKNNIFYVVMQYFFKFEGDFSRGCVDRIYFFD